MQSRPLTACTLCIIKSLPQVETEEVVTSKGQPIKAQVSVRAGKQAAEEPASPKKAGRTVSPPAPHTGPRTRAAAKSAVKA